MTIWAPLKSTRIKGHWSPWGFDATGVSSSGALTRTADEPTYDGTPYLRCAVGAPDSGRAFARGQFALQLAAGVTLRQRFGLFLPAGFGSAVVGSCQVTRLDPFPTLDNAQGLLYDPRANDWRLFVKSHGADSDVTGRFAISEGAWHAVEVQTYLHPSAGWAAICLDGTPVASGDGVRTIYDADGGLVTRFRVGLVAIGSTSQGPLSLAIDAVDLDVGEGR